MKTKALAILVLSLLVFGFATAQTKQKPVTINTPYFTATVDEARRTVSVKAKKGTVSISTYRWKSSPSWLDNEPFIPEVTSTGDVSPGAAATMKLRFGQSEWIEIFYNKDKETGEWEKMTFRSIPMPN